MSSSYKYENQNLLVAIIHNDLEAGLYETGHMLKDGVTDVLEATWIHALSMVAECISAAHVAEFQECIMRLKAIVDEKNDISVDSAFLYTTRLSILCGKFDSIYARPALTKLKEHIVDFFPEGGSLNAAGLDTYKRILPPEGDERMFVVRILAGLARIWADKDYEQSRIALEYLSRKKLAIPKPKWIMPKVLDDHDIVWILWGAILLYCPNNAIVATSYELFCSLWRKQCKTERLGLLWTSFYHVSCSYKNSDDSEQFWAPDEVKIYNHVAANISGLWKQVVGTEQSSNCEGRVSEFCWAEYMPRGNVCQVTDLPHFKDESKTFRIKENKRTTKDETSDSDPRHRRLYPCE